MRTYKDTIWCSSSEDMAFLKIAIEEAIVSGSLLCQSVRSPCCLPALARQQGGSTQGIHLIPPFWSLTLTMASWTSYVEKNVSLQKQQHKSQANNNRGEQSSEFVNIIQGWFNRGLVHGINCCKKQGSFQKELLEPDSQKGLWPSELSAASQRSVSRRSLCTA